MAKRKHSDVNQDDVRLGESEASNTHPQNREELNQFFSTVMELQEDFMLELPPHPDLLQLKEEGVSFDWTSKCQKQLEEVEAASGVYFNQLWIPPEDDEEKGECQCEGLCYCNWQFCGVQ